MGFLERKTLSQNSPVPSKIEVDFLFSGEDRSDDKKQKNLFSVCNSIIAQKSSGLNARSLKVDLIERRGENRIGQTIRVCRVSDL